MLRSCRCAIPLYSLLHCGLMDGLCAGPSLASTMARRNVFDPLEQSGEPRWYAVRNMHGGLLEVRRLAAGTHLKRAFLAALLDYVDAGWRIGEFSSTGGTFCWTQGPERRMVSITPTDLPQLPGYGASHLTESPGHDRWGSIFECCRLAMASERRGCPACYLTIGCPQTRWPGAG